MISDYAHFNRSGLEVEVNWDETVKPCKFIKFKIGEKEVIIPNGDLYTMMMIFGTPEQNETLIPVRETKIKMVTTMLKIRAKKDIKRGETINVAHTYPIGSDTYERIQFEGSGIDKLDRDVKKIGAKAKPKTEYREQIS